jgi:hypothetical protein
MAKIGKSARKRHPRKALFDELTEIKDELGGTKNYFGETL